MRPLAATTLLLTAGALVAAALAPAQSSDPQPQPPAPPDEPEEIFAPIPRKPLDRIIGGSNADASDYPWMVSLSQPNAPDLYSGHFCGGALIHPQWVVTAAHCLEGTLPEDIDVILGVENLSSPGSYERIHVAEIIIHPDYNPANSDSDFALLRLATPAAGGHAVTAGIIDTTALEAAGTTCRVTGWGATDAAGENFPNRLQQVDMPLVDFDTANGVYEQSLTDNMIAAGPGNGTTDSCYGDSGGPLVVFDPALQRWLLTGVVSFGNGCAVVGSYGIYTRMLSFRRFTLDHISPGYSAWESTTGATGRLRDPDGDGRDNLSEFSGRSHPAIPDLPAPPAPGTAIVSNTTYGIIDWPLPARHPELDLAAEFTSDLAQPWQPLDIATHTLATVVGGNTATITLRAPVPLDTAPRRGFFRTSTRLSPLYRPSPRPFTFAARVTGTITTGDTPHPTIASTPAHSYFYQPGAEAGSVVRLFARSNIIDMRLELLDASGATVIDSSTNDDAGGLAGRDEEISFTPAAGTSYQLRVSAESPATTGPYSIGSFAATTFDALPVFTTSGPGSHSLTTASPADPLRQPGPVYRSKDFRISPTATAWRQIKMDSNPIDPLLEIVDAENNKPTGWVDDDSDPGLSNDARLNFRLVAGHHYLVRCTSAFPDETGNFTLATSTPTVPTVAPGSSVNGSLAASDNLDPLDPDAYKDDILASPLVPGQSYTVDLEATAFVPFDAFLYQLDPVTGETRTTDDDSGGNLNSRITFTARETQAIFRVSSVDTPKTGNYTLSVATP